MLLHWLIYLYTIIYKKKYFLCFSTSVHRSLANKEKSECFFGIQLLDDFKHYNFFFIF